MSDLARTLFGDDAPPKRLALVVDLDETVLTGFDTPFPCALDVLLRIDRQRVEVHYVTARTEASRAGTDAFIAEYRLPGYRNVHFCPKWDGTKRHKVERHAVLAREFRVIASIGDTDDEEGAAARAVAVPFVLVDRDAPEPAWVLLAELAAAAGGFRPEG